MRVGTAGGGLVIGDQVIWRWWVGGGLMRETAGSRDGDPYPRGR